MSVCHHQALRHSKSTSFLNSSFSSHPQLHSSSYSPRPRPPPPPPPSETPTIPSQLRSPPYPPPSRSPSPSPPTATASLNSARSFHLNEYEYELTWETLLDMGDSEKYVLDVCRERGRDVPIINKEPKNRVESYVGGFGVIEYRPPTDCGSTGEHIERSSSEAVRGLPAHPTVDNLEPGSYPSKSNKRKPIVTRSGSLPFPSSGTMTPEQSSHPTRSNSHGAAHPRSNRVISRSQVHHYAHPHLTPPRPPREQTSFPPLPHVPPPPKSSPRKLYQSKSMRGKSHTPTPPAAVEDPVREYFNPNPIPIPKKSPSTWPLRSRTRTKSSAPVLSPIRDSFVRTEKDSGPLPPHSNSCSGDDDGVDNYKCLTGKEGRIKLFQKLKDRYPKFVLVNGKVQFVWSTTTENEQQFCGERYYIPSIVPNMKDTSVCEAFFHSSVYMEQFDLYRKNRFPKVIYFRALSEAAIKFDKEHKCVMKDGKDGKGGWKRVRRFIFNDGKGAKGEAKKEETKNKLKENEHSAGGETEVNIDGEKYWKMNFFEDD